MREAFKSKCVVACLVVFGLATMIGMTGCVSDKVIKASNQCSANQTAVRVAELNTLSGKMDNKDVIINMLATKLAGDPCAEMLIAEINGKNKLLNAITLGSVAVIPQYFSYRESKALYNALSGHGTPSNMTVGDISINGTSGSGEGASGDVGINAVIGNGFMTTNDGTMTNQRFDKGILGGEGDINDADSVQSDGLL